MAWSLVFGMGDMAELGGALALVLLNFTSLDDLNGLSVQLLVSSSQGLSFLICKIRGYSQIISKFSLPAFMFYETLSA